MLSREMFLISLRTKTYRKVDLTHKKIENRHGLIVASEFLLFFVDLSSASDRVTAVLQTWIVNIINNKVGKDNRNSLLFSYDFEILSRDMNHAIHKLWHEPRNKPHTFICNRHWTVLQS